VEVTNPRPIVFPNDEALHHDALEWWYYNGHLTDEDGSVYGFHFVIFQGRTDDGRVGYMAHTGLSDLAAGTHDQAGNFSFGEQAAQPSDGFDFIVEDWTLSGSPGLHAVATSIDDRSLELIMLPTKRAVLHDEDGFLESGDGWTYYYSWTHMEATGTLSLPDGDRQVTGTAWMDHQWGDFTVTGYPTGWQWFAVQLDDGSELMITEARDGARAPSVYGTLVRPAGDSIHLGTNGIALTILDTWTSPHTGAEYPASWRISVPDHRLEIELVPTIADQEITLAFPPQTIYWEGTASVSAMQNGEPVPGNAFVELVGYVKPEIG
jgi:predicted secreted hydrolase